MPTLAGRYYNVRSRIGGLREITKFEFTFGAPEETVRRIALPDAGVRRAIGQLGFAIKLSEAQRGAYAGEIDAALRVVEGALDSQGALGRDACMEAERRLLPIAGAAKEYAILCAAHAHIDMNWMWSWQETVAAALSTFRTMLALMREYPDFKFSQSQASVYRIVEQYDPDMMGEIKQRMREGRWEVTATAWVETDKNMPDTESLLRHIRYSRDYLAFVWGVDPASLNIDFSPDTFGHSACVPEIDGYGNVKYMYHCRGLERRQTLYRWRAPSGRELLCHCEPYWYNSGIGPGIAMDAPEFASLAAGLKTSLIVYGVGDHGGGPTRRDIERLLEMRAWPVFPDVRFGSFREYFAAAESVRGALPVVDREINFFSAGCYTTQSRIKLGNRHSEAALLDAEALDALSASLTGRQYPPDKLRGAWQGVLFTHFHDIVTGSCVRDSRDHAMSLYSEALAVAGAAREKAARAIAGQIDTSMIETGDERDALSFGAGAGYGLEGFRGTPSPERGAGAARIYHVFNPSPHERSELAEFTVWDWEHDLRRAQVADHSGRPLPFRLLDEEPKKYWDHRYIRFIAEVRVPAGGYATVVFSEREHGERYKTYTHPFPRTDARHGPIVLENAALRAEFDGASGALRSLVDKRAGGAGAAGGGAVERLAAGALGGLTLVRVEKATSDAWQIGRQLGEELIASAVRIKPVEGAAFGGRLDCEPGGEHGAGGGADSEHGAADGAGCGELRAGFEVEYETLRSKIIQTVTLDRGADALAFRFRITWNEAEADHSYVPLLRYALPLAAQPGSWQSDIPAGAISREGGCRDIPGLQYTAAVYGESAVSLITDCKYGYRGDGSQLSATLINTAGHPDPFPERGEHDIRLWLRLSGSAPKALIDGARAMCHGMIAISGERRDGVLPPARELLCFDAKSCVLSSLGVDADAGACSGLGYAATAEITAAGALAAPSGSAEHPCATVLARFYETGGLSDDVAITMPRRILSAAVVDLDGCALEPLVPDGNCVRLKAAPYSIC
ncbi:MAG: hypothetical protein LBL83_11560, partial [Clostridiales bacterium]|nr:hypothetical protein [Clostridiales bacterium]